jgi:hypothetical protein
MHYQRPDLSEIDWQLIAHTTGYGPKPGKDIATST